MRDTLRQCAKYAMMFYSPAGRFQIAERFCGRTPRYLPCDLLREIRERHGLGGLFAADAILFGWCFAFTFVLDLLSARLFALKSILGFFCCAAAFSLCGEDRSRALLKVCYLAFALLNGGSWCLTAGFLFLFEHIPARP